MSKRMIVVKTRAGSVDHSRLERSELGPEWNASRDPVEAWEDGSLRYSVTKLNSTQNQISKLRLELFPNIRLALAARLTPHTQGIACQM